MANLERVTSSEFADSEGSARDEFAGFELDMSSELISIHVPYCTEHFMGLRDDPQIQRMIKCTGSQSARGLSTPMEASDRHAGGESKITEVSVTWCDGTASGTMSSDKLEVPILHLNDTECSLCKTLGVEDVELTDVVFDGCNFEYLTSESSSMHGNSIVVPHLHVEPFQAVKHLGVLGPPNVHGGFVSGGAKGRDQEVIAQPGPQHAVSRTVPQIKTFRASSPRKLRPIARKMYYQCSPKSCGITFKETLFRKFERPANHLERLYGRRWENPVKLQRKEQFVWHIQDCHMDDLRKIHALLLANRDAPIDRSLRYLFGFLALRALIAGIRQRINWSGRGSFSAAAKRKSIFSKEPTWVSKRPRSEVGASQGDQEKFACPFFARNPEKHSQDRTCAMPGFCSVHRIKEHIYRKHVLGIHCTRCFETFDEEASLRAHHRMDTPCPRQPERELDGIDHDQLARLKSRKHTPGVRTEEERWRKMYMIIFPNDDAAEMPSPYHRVCSLELVAKHKRPDLTDLRAYFSQEVPVEVGRELDNRLGCLLHKLPADLRRDIPLVLRDIGLRVIQRFISLAKDEGHAPTSGLSIEDAPEKAKVAADEGVVTEGASADSALARLLAPFSPLNEENIYDFDWMKHSDPLENPNTMTNLLQVESAYEGEESWGLTDPQP